MHTYAVIHYGYWRAGHSVVVAKNMLEAKKLMIAALRAEFKPGENYMSEDFYEEMDIVIVKPETVHIMYDGDE